MTILQYFRFAWWDFAKRKVACVLNIVFFTVAVYLVCSVVHMANMAQAQRKILEKMVEPELDLVYQVRIREMNIEETTLGKRVNQLIFGIEGMEGVAGSGTYYSTSMRFDELFGNPQMNDILNKNSNLGTSYYPEVYYTDCDLLQVCGVELYQGDMEMFRCENEWIPILVGYDYCNILPVGQMITEARSKQTYKVVGVLQEDSEFFDSGRMIGGLDVSGCLDTYIIIPIQNGISDDSMKAANYMDNICFYAKSEEDANIAKNKILNLAKDNQIDIEIKSLETVIDEEEQEETEEIRMAKILMYVVVGLAIMALVVTGMIQMFTNKREYAIMLANGFGYKTLYKLLLLENVIKVVLALGSGFWLMWVDINGNILQPEKTMQIFMSADVPMVIAIFSMVAVLVTLIPGYIMSKVRISQLV